MKVSAKLQLELDNLISIECLLYDASSWEVISRPHFWGFNVIRDARIFGFVS